MEPSIREPQVKRRKIRKGTRSCWECKGRKVRCTYLTPEDDVCDGCFRRGTNCVSQEKPEQPLATIDRGRQIGNRMVRVESLIERLVKKVGDGPPVPGLSNSEPNRGASLNAEVLRSASAGATQPPDTTMDALATPRSMVNSPDPFVIEKLKTSDLLKYEKISQALLATFPSQESVNMIVKIAGPIPSFFHQLLLRKPYKDIRIGEKEKADQLAELTVRPTSKTHPLIIARQMLLLAISFRYIHPAVHHELQGFSEPPGIIMQRVADAAIDLVTTNDKMIGNLEGIECLLLTSTFQADNGNIRAGWTSTRRAMLTAQLMCLHRQKRPPLKSVQPGSKWDPQFLWYRIVYYDRFFSLILGLPQGSTDTFLGAVFPFEDDTAMDRLERRHCVLASQILLRNERDSSSDDVLDIQAVDMELRNLSESMPSKWWLVPNLASIQDSGQLLWATVRLTNQVFHYILLSHLHLPFILHSPSGPDQHRHEYSRVACINASRDLLQRYMAFRTFNHVSYCCHSMDFFAITASMTLILAHLDAHHSKRDSDNALVHQRTSDRANMEEILDNMEQVGTLNKARTMSERGASVLRQLLAIEADAARGSSYRLETGESHQNDTRALRLSIPYFGVVIITQDRQNLNKVHKDSPLGTRNATGVASSGRSPPRAPTGRTSPLQGPGYMADYTPSTTLQHQGTHPVSRGFGEQLNSTTSAMRTAESADFLPDFQEPPGDFAHARPYEPSMTTDQEDWALQGVDMSFFDALMRDSNAQTGSESDYWWLL